MKAADPTPPKRLRCAIYTRKSSEEGLDQAFNSLHAQREACEAYILSQAGEGWIALPTHYDDGGFSGGTMERPALKALLADIAAKRIDVIVVYKVDRLTRALADFAKIVERFDQNGVSFVSVTQAFNTTSSMGRLTLNVLLSFAQFEREVTSERIRDKITASKAKGMWMGGTPPLGYDPPTDPKTRALVVNANEAETVQLIFRRYLEIGSVYELIRVLNCEGIISKRLMLRNGQVRGGVPINRGALFHLLKNRVYLGEICHRGKTARAGAHPPIIDQAVFDTVQRMLSPMKKRRPGPGRPGSSLVGRIFGAKGERLTHAATINRHGKSYRYYVSGRIGGGLSDELVRINANEVEALVANTLDRLGGTNAGALRRIEVLPYSVRLQLSYDQNDRRLDLKLRGLERRLSPGEDITMDDNAIWVTLPIRLKSRGGRTWIVQPLSGFNAQPSRPDRALIKALARARRIAREHGIIGSFVEASHSARSPGDPYLRGLVKLAFLAPDIQSQILAGRQPAWLTLRWLLQDGVALSWNEQRRRILAPAPI